MAEDKLHLLAELNGVTVDELLEWAACSRIAPGICMKRDCDYITNVEADQNEGYCELCETQTVQSAPWLTGIDDLLLFEPKLDLIKLHGSLNWLTVTRSFQSSVATLPDDNNDLAMLYNPENSVSYFNSKDIFNYSIDFAQINKDLTIIKPTIGKEYAKWPFANLVKKAMDALNSAKNVYLLGYSMPMYDTISEFLILSVNENAKLRIVNKDKDAEVLKERIARGSKLEWNQIEEFSDGIEEWIKKQIRGSLK